MRHSITLVNALSKPYQSGHTQIGFALSWAHQENGFNSRPVCVGMPSPLFIVRSETSCVIYAFNRVGTSELRSGSIDLPHELPQSLSRPHQLRFPPCPSTSSAYLRHLGNTLHHHTVRGVTFSSSYVDVFFSLANRCLTRCHRLSFLCPSPPIVPSSLPLVVSSVIAT